MGYDSFSNRKSAENGDLTLQGINPFPPNGKRKRNLQLKTAGWKGICDRHLWAPGLRVRTAGGEVLEWTKDLNS